MLKNEALKKIKMYNINFGPQHPSAHVGLLHRGTEKLIAYYRNSVHFLLFKPEFLIPCLKFLAVLAAFVAILIYTIYLYNIIESIAFNKFKADIIPFIDRNLIKLRNSNFSIFKFTLFKIEDHETSLQIFLYICRKLSLFLIFNILVLIFLEYFLGCTFILLKVFSALYLYKRPIVSIVTVFALIKTKNIYRIWYKHPINTIRMLLSKRKGSNIPLLVKASYNFFCVFLALAIQIQCDFFFDIIINLRSLIAYFIISGYILAYIIKHKYIFKELFFEQDYKEFVVFYYNEEDLWAHYKYNDSKSCIKKYRIYQRALFSEKTGFHYKKDPLVHYYFKGYKDYKD